jgi:hypothetical protein
MTKLANKENIVVINTGLTDSASLNVLKSTIGQLSDGIWENSRKAEQYWPFADAEMIDGNVCLVISNDLYKGRHYFNGFRVNLAMDPVRIKDYFAKKIRAVVRENAKDYPDAGIKCTAKCNVALDYMSDYDNHDNEIRACDAHKVYAALRIK